ncbi:MAG: hypothetical protein WD379_09270 [Dehalococcoidia bacterium]
MVRGVREIGQRLRRAPRRWKAAGGFVCVATLLLVALVAVASGGGGDDTAVAGVSRSPAAGSDLIRIPKHRPPPPTPTPTPTPLPTPAPTATPLPATPTPAPTPPPTPTPLPPTPTPTPVPVVCAPYLSWVWQFSVDGEPEEIADVLSARGMGIILKTHKGTHWMAEEDESPEAVSGPAQVSKLAQYFESRGVPFHAYVVPTGEDPLKEAAMAAAVLEAGARSIFLDLEPWHGYWKGSAADAAVYSQELRRLSPDGVVVSVVEPRPWALKLLPMAEFVAVSDAIAPLIYWETFSSEANLKLFSDYGWPTGAAGMTPEFLLDVSEGLLGEYGLPIWPVGQGASANMGAWQRFLDDAAKSGMPEASVWRYGVTNPGVYDVLDGQPAAAGAC